MRNIDKRASEEFFIPSIVLMENAGLRCVEVLNERFSGVKNLKVGIFCGKGNNAGDGFVIARQLDRLGAEVDVFTLLGHNFTPDTQINFNMLQNTNCTVMENTEFPEYEIPAYDVVVDAILGTGVKDGVCGDLADIIEVINKNARFVLSVDVPSGINSDTGEVLGACVKADITVTFAAFKRGLLLYPAADFCGQVIVVDICIPDILLSDININLTDEEFIRDRFPDRYDNSHKGDYGKVLIVAGSKGMSGAAYMAAQAALVAGSGLVTIACPDEINDILEEKTTEVMTISLKSQNGHLSRACIDDLIDILPHYDAVLFGPGLGRSEDIVEILEALAENCEVPLIIDADGLFALSVRPEIISRCNCGLILTPHEQEMTRLLGCKLSDVTMKRIEVSDEYAENNGVTLILKGRYTIVTSPDRTQYISIEGNSGMATAGSGDVLAGICVSLSGRNVSEEEAGALAVFIHQRAGDIAKDLYGKESVTAGTILECIPKALKSVLR